MKILWGNLTRIVIVGGGPAGLFAALKLSQQKDFEVILIEKNSTLGGAGLHSDGKLNFHPLVGGNLLEFLNQKEVYKLIEEIKQTFIKFGVPQPSFNQKAAKKVEKISIKNGIKFLPVPQTHVGSDHLPFVIENFKKELRKRGVKILFNTTMLDAKIENKRIKEIITDKGKISADFFLFALGRSGFEWFLKFVNKNNLSYFYNPIDIGVRVEVPDEVFDEIVNKYKIWDPKFFIRTKSYDDFVRTFCTNPSGFVVKEYYGNSLVGVNGHAMKNVKSKNTNFALLVTVKLTHPLENTTLYGKRIVQLANTLGGNKPLIQRLSDLENHRRSTWERIERSYITPTLKDVTPGDISMAYPERIVTNLIESLKLLDKVLPGIFSDSTLLYAPEVKFYAIRLATTKKLQSIDIKNLFVAGDGAGVSRGIVGAAATGIIAAKGILEAAK